MRNVAKALSTIRIVDYKRWPTHFMVSQNHERKHVEFNVWL